jgi:PAS domain S-box-containing protein
LCKITGHSQEELIGINQGQYASPETAEKLFQVFNQISRAGKPLILVDLEINLKDGTIITVDLSVTPIKTPDNQIVGFRGLMRDVTERKRAEQERQKLEKKLQQAQKMKAIGTLAGGVAHDLNNILSGIVSYPDLILMDLPRQSPLFEPIQTIQESGKKAAAIVQDLLTLARRGVSISEILNLNDIITEYLDSPQLAKLKSFHPLVGVKTHLDSALLNIKGSPVHLSKTVMNLVSNAAEAMPEGGTVLIKAENQYIDKPIRGYDDVEEGDYVVLTVSDTGIGIHPDEISQIFEPFYTKKVMGRSGTGLGMAVVWGTVKDHKGYIHVESDMGRGTIFKLYFPVTRKQNAEHQYDKKSVDYQGNGESILVVDDAQQQREIASKILSQLGYSVKTVESGEEAVAFLQKNTVDLIVLDMIMPPGIDGLETYERIIELHPTQKAIIASGYSETGRVKKAQQLGAGKYVKKPYTVKKIGLAVKAELAKPQKAA